jgi:hypothetical protein
MFNTALHFNQIEVIKYFIFNLNIERSNYINEFLEKKPNKEVEDLFRLRKLNQDLNNELSLGSNNIKRSKI